MNGDGDGDSNSHSYSNKDNGKGDMDDNKGNGKGDGYKYDSKKGNDSGRDDNKRQQRQCPSTQQSTGVVLSWVGHWITSLTLP